MIDNYRVGSFCLHDIQKTLHQGIKTVFGEGGNLKLKKGEKDTKKKNAMQLLHGLWNLSNYLDEDFFKEAWKLACDNLGMNVKYVKLSQPVLTRWWLVGQCACEVADNWDL